MVEWTFQSIRKAEQTALVPGNEEQPDAGGARRLSQLRTANRLKYISICVAVVGLCLSTVGVVMAVLAATGAFSSGSVTFQVVTGNTTIIVTTPADAEFAFSPNSPPPYPPHPPVPPLPPGPPPKPPAPPRTPPSPPGTPPTTPQ